MVTITDDVEADVSADGKRIVVVMARIHPCDAISSFVIQGQQLSFFSFNFEIVTYLAIWLTWSK